MPRYTTHEFNDLHGQHQRVLLDRETGVVLARANPDVRIGQTKHLRALALAADALNVAPEVRGLRERVAALRLANGFPSQHAGAAQPLHRLEPMENGAWRLYEPRPEWADVPALVDIHDRIVAQSIKVALDDFVLVHNDLGDLLWYLTPENAENVFGAPRDEAADILIEARRVLADYWRPLIAPVAQAPHALRGQTVGPTVPWLAAMDQRIAEVEQERAPAPGPGMR